jgi:hypothetical protein
VLAETTAFNYLFVVQMDNTTVSSLYELENGSTIHMQHEIPLAIRAKTMALFDRATRLARHASFVFQRRKHHLLHSLIVRVLIA